MNSFLSLGIPQCVPPSPAKQLSVLSLTEDVLSLYGDMHDVSSQIFKAIFKGVTSEMIIHVYVVKL